MFVNGSVCLCLCVSLCVYVCVCVYIYIYIYIYSLHLAESGSRGGAKKFAGAAGEGSGEGGVLRPGGTGEGSWSTCGPQDELLEIDRILSTLPLGPGAGRRSELKGGGLGGGQGALELMIGHVLTSVWWAGGGGGVAQSHHGSVADSSEGVLSDRICVLYKMCSLCMECVIIPFCCL